MRAKYDATQRASVMTTSHAIYCNIPQYAAIYNNMQYDLKCNMQYAAICNILQHTIKYNRAMQSNQAQNSPARQSAAHCDTAHHSAHIPCGTAQHIPMQVYNRIQHTTPRHNLMHLASVTTICYIPAYYIAIIYYILTYNL